MTPHDQDTPPRRAATASSREIADAAVAGRSRGPFADLRRRIQLTIQYHGWRTLLYRLLTFPLRFTPLRHRLRLRTQASDADRRRASAWYRAHGRPVDIVIPSFRDAERVATLVGEHPAHGAAREWRGSSSPTTRAAPSTSPRCARSTGSR